MELMSLVLLRTVGKGLKSILILHNLIFFIKNSLLNSSRAKALKNLKLFWTFLHPSLKNYILPSLLNDKEIIFFLAQPVYMNVPKFIFYLCMVILM